MTAPSRLRHGADALADIARDAVARAERAGVTAIAHVSESAGLRVTVHDGAVDLVTGDQSQWLSVTVRNGDRQGSAGTARFDADALDAVVAEARALAGFAGDDPDGAPPSPDDLAWHPRAIPLLASTDWASADLEAQALEMDRAARDEAGATMHVVDQAGVASHDHAIAMAASGGFAAGYGASTAARWCAVAAGAEGDRRVGDRSSTRRDHRALATTAEIGRDATCRAVAKLRPRPPTPGAWPVLFEPQTARDIIGGLVGALSGPAQVQRSGFLTDAVGRPVMAGHLTLTEDPFLPFGMASSPFDGEGVEGRQRSVVERGIATDYFLDTRWARRLGRRGTGNAGGPHNLRLVSDRTERADDRDAMLAKLGTGLVVASLSNQGVNPFTGDWSRAVTGFWVERGEIVHPVEGVTLIGTMTRMLQDIVAVGADIDDEAAIVTGSLLIDRMEVAC